VFRLANRGTSDKLKSIKDASDLPPRDAQLISIINKDTGVTLITVL